MKGFLYIVILYFLVFLICSLVKYLKNKDFKIANKKSAVSTPKIYYITNNKPKVKKQKHIDIAIKGTEIDKED